jgi:transcriptional regulator with XRE-family HTH domain
MERKNEQLIAAFSKVLKERRKAAGLSQEELAFRTDLSMSYMSLLETRNRQPTLTVMAALAKELGLSLEELTQRIEAEYRK